jgi:hypothetical protein
MVPHSSEPGAIKIDGSPFETFAEAEEAYNVMLNHLTRGS